MLPIQGQHGIAIADFRISKVVYVVVSGEAQAFSVLYSGDTGNHLAGSMNTIRHGEHRYQIRWILCLFNFSLNV